VHGSSISEESSHSSLTQTSSGEDEETGHGIRELFGNPEFWSILYPGKLPPYMGDSVSNDPADGFEAFGMNQPGIRRAGWTLVHLLVAKHLGAWRFLLSSTVGVLSIALTLSIR
jgi:hypothetical protein